MTTISDFPKNVYRYHPAISEWMYLVESGKFEACQEQHELINIVKEKLDQDNVRIDNLKIEKVIERSERYFFELLPFQKFFLSFVVGVYYDDDTLVYDEYLFLAGRGTGKNGLLSALILSLSDINNVPSYNIDIVATTQDQAMTSFDDVYELIDSDKKLQKAFKHTKKLITHKKTRSKIKYHTSNARSKDGLRSGAVIFDEIHEFENDDLINVFSSGLGKKKFPRLFYLTTDGFVRGGFLDEMKKTAQEILKRATIHLRLLPFIFKLDDPEEVHDKTKWVKAIPRLAYDLTLRNQVEKEYEKALNSTSKMIEFLTKRMNIPTEDAFAVVAEWEDIEATEQEYPTNLEQLPCVAALDYADIRDFASCGLLFRDKDKRYFMQHTFICKRSLKLTKFKFDIKRAVAEGYATIVDDAFIRPEYIVEWFVEQRKKYRFDKVVADRWRINDVRNAFEKYNIPVEEVPSGPITHGKIAGKVDILFSSRNVVFGKDFMMRWYTNNVFVKFDSKGNKTYEKIEPKTRKTDGFMCFIHALVKEPEYKPPITRPSRRLKTAVGH